MFLKQIIMKKYCSLFYLFNLAVSTLLAFSFTKSIHAQYRNFNIVYSDNARGNIVMFGNTLMAIVDNNTINGGKMNDNAADGYSSFGNDFENMQYVDVDGNGLLGSGTRNSSMADFSLPAGTNTIKLARLYWGGRVKDSDFDLTQPANKKIKIRKGTFLSYSEFTATQIDKNNFIQNNEAFTRYQAFTDITSFIQAGGTGTYCVGNTPLSVGSIDFGGNYGGWCIVIVYENPSSNYNSIRLYDGFQQVFNDGNPLTTSVTLTGLNVPSAPLIASDAKMGAITWEGDANLVGDYLKINNTLFSNAINPANNPWNGTISTNAVHFTGKNPDYTNQMGIDIDQFEVGASYGILPNATSVTLEFGTEADQYFPGIFSFVIRMKEPAITLDKFVSDANLNSKAEIGEVLTYTIKGKNLGPGNTNNVIMTDTLPGGVTYLPNSLKVISCPGITPGIKTDIESDDIAEHITNGTVHTVRFRLGTGATPTSGGVLAADESYEIEFKVTVNNPGQGKPVPSVINSARVKATSDANLELTDDGTAIINPEAGALPVVLLYFNSTLQNNKNVLVTWGTSMEINSRHFEIERSEDGNLFTTVATIPGSGTTSLPHNYSITDEVTLVISPVVYYRLKQVDLNGRQTFSQINVVRLKKDLRPLVISPNPFTDQLKITFEWSQDEAAAIKLIDVAGKVISIKLIQLFKGTNFTRIDNLSRLQAGSYFIEIASQKEKVVRNVLKNNK